MSQPCSWCFRPETVRMRGRNNALTSSLHTIERYAMNSKGDVGSLYNAYTDNLLITSSTNKDLLMQKNVQETPSCKLIKVYARDHNNILKLAEIDGELRISVALGMTTVTEGISMLYSYTPPDDHTVRLISYCRVDQEEYLPYDIQIVRKILPDSLPDQNVTHVITSVRRGVDFVIVLELPKSEDQHEIDAVLEKLCDYFINSKSTFLSTEDQRKINHLKPIIFTSITDIHSFTKDKDLSVICQQIQHYIYQNSSKSTLSYTLHPTKCIYHDTLFTDTQHCKLDVCFVWKVEEKILPVSNRLRRLVHLFSERVKLQLLPFVKTRIELTSKEICRVESMYTEIQQRLATKVEKLRHGQLSLSLLEKELNDIHFTTLNSQLNTLQNTITELQTKMDFIANFKADFQMEYVNVADLEESGDNQEALENKLLHRDQQHSRHYLCFTSVLTERDPNGFKKLWENLKAELCPTTLASYPTFADFSYCNYKLESMKILRPTSPSKISCSIVKAEEINILLIGETGVGKSTFINAFVNYLAFSSLQQAVDQKPIVLIPVSFLITLGHDFEEKHIEFGQFDANEDHNHSGQSVTQYCKSYIFTIQNNIKLRIIDTPGFGDTRGVEQDDKNIDHVLSYISNLPHLNAVCFLMRPNSARLHVLFRSCFTQLFNFLGSNIRENVIFCFTNTRATFYAPGETTNLLKAMLNQLPGDHKPPFAKQNTFCFDSESFRYLAVIKSGHTLAFGEEQKQDFERSWKTSVTESIRLLNLVKSRPQFPMNRWHSVKHAQMTITLLVQPILETIRNSVRNPILWKLDNRLRTIELKARPVSLPACLCASCPYTITTVENISIVTHQIYVYRACNKSSRCRCASDEHLPIFYQLGYLRGSIRSMDFLEEASRMKDRLLSGSVILSKFLLYTTGTSHNPFLMWFDLFIRQQEYLCSKEPSSIVNIKLCNGLCIERDKYANDLQSITRDGQQVQLNAVYECLDEILAYRIIAEQMNAIQESQMRMMKDNECDVSSQYSHMNSFF